MKPSESIQFCLDKFGHQMWSDKREEVYQSLSLAKKQEMLLHRLFEHAMVIINENHPDYKLYKELTHEEFGVNN